MVGGEAAVAPEEVQAPLRVADRCELLAQRGRGGGRAVDAHDRRQRKVVRPGGWRGARDDARGRRARQHQLRRRTACRASRPETLLGCVQGRLTVRSSCSGGPPACRGRSAGVSMLVQSPQSAVRASHT